MIITAEILEELEKVDPNTRAIFTKLFKQIEKAIGEVVTRKEFVELTKQVQELTKTVQELVKAQRKTDERVGKLEEAVRKLIEAQRKTDEKIKELIEAQRKTDERVGKLEEAVRELIEAQKQTDEKIKELIEAQRKTDEKIKELAEAQKQTEQALRTLVGDHKKTREQLGGLSHTVGYVLEDRAYKSLPKLLKEDFGVEIEGGLKRDYIEVGRNKYEEINIIGKGKKDGREVLILGEAKTQLKKSDIDSFMEKINRLKAHLGYGEKILVFVTYQASPPVREYAKQKGVAVYFS